MICHHGYDGQAWVKRVGENHQWGRADLRITATDEVTHMPEFLAVYEVGDWCNDTGAWHATRRFT